jgi:hypothetical protein
VGYIALFNSNKKNQTFFFLNFLKLYSHRK